MRLYFVDKAKIFEAIKGFARGDTGYSAGAIQSIYSHEPEKSDQYVPVLSKKRLFEYARLFTAYRWAANYRVTIEHGLSGVQHALNADLILNQNRIQVASAIRNNISQDLSGETDYLAVTKKLARFCKSAAPLSWEIIQPILLVAAALVEPRETPVNKPRAWDDYERECAIALRGAGFDVKLTSGGADYGADLICFKDHRTFAIQCKLYSRSVGLKAVQEILAARSHYSADFAVVCSESGFTLAAATLAGSNVVHLTNLAGLTKIDDVWP